MYYIWVSEPSSENEAIIYGVPDTIEKLGLRFDTGRRWERSVPPITMVRDEDSQGLLTDNLIAPGARGLVLSGRLRDALVKAGVRDIEYFPLRIVNPHDGSFTDDYMIANIIGRTACMDMDASVFDAHPGNPSVIEHIDVLVIDDNRAEGRLMFRMDEHHQVIIVHEKVKKACEAANASGVVFYAPEEFIL